MAHDVTDGVIYEALLRELETVIAVSRQRARSSPATRTSHRGLIARKDEGQLHYHRRHSPTFVSAPGEGAYGRKQVATSDEAAGSTSTSGGGSVRFHWDEGSKCVIRLESQLDMLSPMLKLLSSLEAVAQVFDQAVVTPVD
ncbi:hypothetical protein PHYPSEUDO_002633 [Phytophthora pseudosyringae]|uniref:Uncharacterized protein n=1 Tax=Phytophthora pseudosyringae TaxID=221518 RepID=A0A8T1V582_9STRA|nr:hypothetical protein PHYPSEUDO_002633 [Phytophthora pseudosyringae]